MVEGIFIDNRIMLLTCKKEKKRKKKILLVFFGAKSPCITVSSIVCNDCKLYTKSEKKKM
jgi:hypothetical protein